MIASAMRSLAVIRSWKMLPMLSIVLLLLPLLCYPRHSDVLPAAEAGASLGAVLEPVVAQHAACTSYHGRAHLLGVDVEGLAHCQLAELSGDVDTLHCVFLIG